MSPYLVQVDSLYLHTIKGSLLKGKQISLLPLRLQKHKNYDLKISTAPIRLGSWISSSRLFGFYENEGGILIKIDIHLAQIQPCKHIF